SGPASTGFMDRLRSSIPPVLSRIAGGLAAGRGLRRPFAWNEQTCQSEDQQPKQKHERGRVAHVEAVSGRLARSEGLLQEEFESRLSSTTVANSPREEAPGSWTCNFDNIVASDLEGDFTIASLPLIQVLADYGIVDPSQRPPVQPRIQYEYRGHQNDTQYQVGKRRPKPWQNAPNEQRAEAE